MDIADGAFQAASHQMAVDQVREHLDSLRKHGSQLRPVDAIRIARDLDWHMRDGRVDLSEVATTLEELAAFGIDTSAYIN